MYGPIDIGREEAQELARRELAKPGYARESLLEQMWRRVQEWLEELLNGAGALPGGWFSVIALLLLLVGLAIVIRLYVGKSTQAGGGPGGVFGERVFTAAEHRAAAESHAAAGRWTEAIQERVRAVARELEERVIVDPLPGRTADELAAEAAKTLPEHKDALVAGARLFDDVTYGEHPGSEEGYDSVTALDNRVRTAKPTLAGSPA